MENFIKWADRRNFISVRAITLYVTVWMTWESFAWAAIFASTTTLDGMQSAAMIAAVTAPICALQGFIFKFYMEAK